MGARRHDSVLFSIFCTVYRAVLRFKKEHQQVKLGVSEQEVNKTIKFKSESNVECKVLGLTKEEQTELKYEVEKAALLCSHAIVAARYQKE